MITAILIWLGMTACVIFNPFHKDNLTCEQYKIAQQSGKLSGIDIREHFYHGHGTKQKKEPPK